MQFSTESGTSYGDPLFYIDSIQVIDDATGKVYKADGSFFEDEEGPLTFDAGIAVYSVLGLAGVAGSLSVMAKRKK